MGGSGVAVEVDTPSWLENAFHLYQPYRHVGEVCLHTLPTDIPPRGDCCLERLVLRLKGFYSLFFDFVKTPCVRKYSTGGLTSYWGSVVVF